MRPGMLVTTPEFPGVVFILTAMHTADQPGRIRDGADHKIDCDLVEYQPPGMAVPIRVTRLHHHVEPLRPCPLCTPVDRITQIDGSTTTWQPYGLDCDPTCSVGTAARALGTVVR